MTPTPEPVRDVSGSGESRTTNSPELFPVNELWSVDLTAHLMQGLQLQRPMARTRSCLNSNEGMTPHTQTLSECIWPARPTDNKSQ